VRRVLKRVAAIGSSTAVIGALLTGALSSPAFAACPSALAPTAVGGVYQLTTPGNIEWIRSANVNGTDDQLAYNYAMTGDIDMGNCTWTSPIAPTPGVSIGDFTGTPFSGSFDGGGYTVSGLTIDDGNRSTATSTNNMALFGYTNGATIQNLTFTGSVFGRSNTACVIGVAISTTVSNVGATGAVTGYADQVGGLIGRTYSNSSISDSWSTGSVDGVGDDSDDVGGLVGQADDSEILRSWASGDVDADDDNAGGLLGNSDGTRISGSWATGSVEGDESIGGLLGFGENSTNVSDSYATGEVTGEDLIGGLVGEAVGISISDSWASGDVTGSVDDVGGLIGQADAKLDPDTDVVITVTTVTSSWATGAVTGVQNVGGLIGETNHGSPVTTSYATGTVTSTDGDAGGLVGDNDGEISTSFAAGTVSHTDVSGDENFGGLVGVNKTPGSITDSYATGIVNALGTGAGGLVGDNRGSVVRSYSVGQISANADAGGLIGQDNGGSVSSSYWDTETSGLTISAGGSDSSTGGSGKTTSEMQDVATFAGWSIAQGFNSSLIWAICLNVNSGYPYFTWSYASDPCVTDVDYQFTFRLPDGTECGAIGPVGVIDGTIYILPGEDADCRTMDGATVGGWTIPVPEGYDSIGSPAMPFAPGQKVRVSDSQQFTVVPFEPLLSLTLDSNVMADESCEANEVEFVDEANRVEYSWVPRADISVARLPVVGACQPPGYTLAGWNTASDGSGMMLEPGAGLPSDWATDKTNRYRLFAIWTPA